MGFGIIFFLLVYVDELSVASVKVVDLVGYVLDLDSFRC